MHTFTCLNTSPFSKEHRVSITYRKYTNCLLQHRDSILCEHSWSWLIGMQSQVPEKDTETSRDHCLPAGREQLHIYFFNLILICSTKKPPVLTSEVKIYEFFSCWVPYCSKNINVQWFTLSEYFTYCFGNENVSKTMDLHVCTHMEWGKMSYTWKLILVMNINGQKMRWLFWTKSYEFHSILVEMLNIITKCTAFSFFLSYLFDIDAGIMLRVQKMLRICFTMELQPHPIEFVSSRYYGSSCWV